jgi:hypothetical protein
MVRVAYIQERGRWESLKSRKPITYKPPRRYDGVRPVTIDGEVTLENGQVSVWAKIITWCEARTIPPTEYIRVCFANLPMISCAPEPIQLLGEKYLQIWNDTWEGMPIKLQEELTSQHQIARTNMIVQQRVYGETPEDAQLLVLTDSSLELSPLFRYCIAASINTKPLRRVATTFRAEAVLQYECYPTLYAAAWRDILPKGFAELSKTAYPAVIAQQLGLIVATNDNTDPND